MSCVASDEPALAGPEVLFATPAFHKTTRTLRAVDFIDAERGWAVGDHGTVLATTGGGRTWTAKGAGPPF